MEFPHLNDTRFPLLDNVNVYSYRNNFDYTRWVPRTKVKLTNVLWNGDYRDVVKFEDNTARDDWFDSHEDYYEVTLTSSHSIPPEGGIKLPIPYDIAVRYNYIVVDIPVMTSEDNPIEYEDVSKGTRRWHFFVDEVSSRAPNTTMFEISLDVWTQFSNDVVINYLFLERGHAPVAATDVDEYLENPIENNDYLLTPDVTPTNPNVVRESHFIPFGNGRKYVCFALTLAAPQIDTLPSASESSMYSPNGSITYSDIDARNGYQLQVNGYGAGNGYDYSNLKNPVQMIVTEASDARIPHNTTIWAIEAEEVYGNGTFFNDVMKICPQFMNSILGCFVVDSSMVHIRSTHTVANHPVYEVYGRGSSQDVSLSKEDFGFPERYQRFAKLYTYPYSEIELTDNEGKKVSVRIENTGAMSAHLITSVAFPFVNMRMFFTGINGVGSETYSWVNLWNYTSSEEISNSDWFDYCFDHEIPCYALYMDGAAAWYLDNFNRSVRGSRRNALVSYHNSVRIANTTRENTVDSDAAMYANADADATTLTTNTNNIANNNTTNTNLTIATNTLLATLAQQSGTNIKNSNNTKAFATKEAANTFTSTTTLQENETSTSVANGAAGVSIGGAAGSVIAGSAIAGGAMGLSAGTVAPGVGNIAGAAAGAAVGALVGLSNVAASAANSYNAAVGAAQVNTYTATQQVRSNDTNYNATVTNNNESQQQINIDIHNKNVNNNSLLRDHTSNNNSTNRTNAGNTAATMRGNANRSKTVGDANATYTRGTLVDNAKETLENSRDGVRYAMADAGNGPARVIAAYTGDPTADYMRTRGVQMKVRTMPNAEVRQVGDWFARYGYALEQVWDVSESGLCPMNHFCYWKCRDIWIDDLRSSNNTAITLMQTMFERGITIWKNPDEVGKVSVYDN